MYLVFKYKKSILCPALTSNLSKQRQILNWSGQAALSMSDERFGRYKTAAFY